MSIDLQCFRVSQKANHKAKDDHKKAQQKYNKNTTFIRKHKKIQLYITEYKSIKNGSNPLFQCV